MLVKFFSSLVNKTDCNQEAIEDYLEVMGLLTS